MTGNSVRAVQLKVTETDEEEGLHAACVGSDCGK